MIKCKFYSKIFGMLNQKFDLMSFKNNVFVMKFTKIKIDIIKYTNFFLIRKIHKKVVCLLFEFHKMKNN